MANKLLVRLFAKPFALNGSHKGDGEMEEREREARETLAEDRVASGKRLANENILRKC